MNILLCAATIAEIAPLKAHFDERWTKVSENLYAGPHVQVQLCITGVGMVATTYGLTRMLSGDWFDFAVQAGIGGSFDRSIALGDVVMVETDLFGDIGAEDHDNYLDIYELGLADRDEQPFMDGRLKQPASLYVSKLDLKRISGITVNTVTGNAQSVERLAKRYGCQVESMEGAAFHYVCLQEQVPFVQLRGISNYVEPRDRSKWQIGPAVKNLNDTLIPFLEHMLLA